MARLTTQEFEKAEKNSTKLHNKVVATYTIVHADNEKVVQIDTYGSEERKFIGKCSQSIQIDKEMAKRIMEIFAEEGMV